MSMTFAEKWEKICPPGCMDQKKIRAFEKARSNKMKRDSQERARLQREIDYKSLTIKDTFKRLGASRIDVHCWRHPYWEYKVKLDLYYNVKKKQNEIKNLREGGPGGNRQLVYIYDADKEIRKTNKELLPYIEEFNKTFPYRKDFR